MPETEQQPGYATRSGGEWFEGELWWLANNRGSHVNARAIEYVHEITALRASLADTTAGARLAIEAAELAQQQRDAAQETADAALAQNARLLAALEQAQAWGTGMKAAARYYRGWLDDAGYLDDYGQVRMYEKAQERKP